MNGSGGDLQWVLWSGTVGLESPLLDRFPAAEAGGYDLLSLSPLDIARASEQGVSPGDISRRADDCGLGLIVDPVMNWHPAAEPSRSRFARFGVDEALRMSEGVGAVSMTAIASSTSAAPVDELVGLFGALCDRAADIGARVHVEFIPMTAIPDVATAWRIVRDADRPNGGILFDTWHFFRGSADFVNLEAVPGERILAVQVDDAAVEVSGSLWEDTQRRLLPGDGCFDLPRVLRTLVRIGGLRFVGPEVISPETAAMPAADAAQVAGERVRALVTDALAVGRGTEMNATKESEMDRELEVLLAERAIAWVLCTYSRAADRFDLELMRSCYWPDGTDDHGSYDGEVDGFIEFVGPALRRFDRTNHFLGNMLIDVDLPNDVARAETYAVAYHRLHDTAGGREQDMVAGLRYVDRFQRRDSEWRIARRVCAFEWRRTDPVGDGSSFAETYTRGLRGSGDIVWHILDAAPAVTNNG